MLARADGARERERFPRGVECVWKWEEFDGVVCGCGWDALEWHTVLGGGTEGRGGESHYRQEHYAHSYIRDGEESKECQD